MIEFPHEGVQCWTNSHGIRIFRLHYDADPEKGGGEKILIPELNKALSPWAKAQYDAMTDKAMYAQEFEIDFSAKLGTLLYLIDEEATLERSFPIPPSWTRYFALDPHPSVPHAALWLAMDPWGDGWLYRELWPSKVYGKPGNIPEDDNRVTIKDYVETVLWLESKANPQNSGKDENIYLRVIDYAARAFGKGTSDDKEQPNFQERFEQAGLYPFQDAKKDHEVGISVVNEWLKPRDVEQPDGTFRKRSRLHIFGDECPETVYQLKTNRYQMLTPLMADRQDPTGKPVAKRNHMTDNLRYLCMSEPTYVQPMTHQASAWKPITAGIAY
jgi:hypothetical protein